MGFNSAFKGLITDGAYIPKLKIYILPFVFIDN